MSEVALAEKTEVTPPEDDALTAPESTPDPVTTPDDQDDGVLNAILEGLGDDGAAQGEGDGMGAPTDGVVPPSETKALTPDEAREQGRREKEAELETQRTSLERQRYIDGLNYVVQDVPLKLTALAEKYSMAPSDVTDLYTQFNRLNGAYKPLYDHSLEQASPGIKTQAYREAETEVSRLVLSAVSEELGEPAMKAIQTAAPKTWEDLAKAIAKEARKGLVAKDEVIKGQKALGKKIDTALKERGMSLADLTGNGGTIRHNIGNGSTNAQPGTEEWAHNAPISELIADKARRAAAG